MDPTPEMYHIFSSMVTEGTIVNPTLATVSLSALDQLDHGQLILQDSYIIDTSGCETEDLFGWEFIQTHQSPNYNPVDAFSPSGLFLTAPESYRDNISFQQEYQHQQCWYDKAQIQLYTASPSFLVQHEPSVFDFSSFRSQDSSVMSSPEGSPSFSSDHSSFDHTDSEHHDLGSEGDVLAVPFADLSVITGTSQVLASFSLQIPTLFSSERQQSISLASDFSDQSEFKSDISKRKKRLRKKTDSTVKPRTPKLSLKCPHENCNITCSSYPSLARHNATHEWRGKYHPLRCEACQSGLSNEYAVQRHIRRAADILPCRRMSVYSIMKSQTEVESTVRFYPGRGHGKKTVQVNLEEMRAIYLNGRSRR
ncbi:hypothetical protein BGX27_007526 [Mortierella sp. AM989]|nr:hypothetical protein BGX27_007526 [Mortierella sp. AM989]